MKKKKNDDPSTEDLNEFMINIDEQVQNALIEIVFKKNKKEFRKYTPPCNLIAYFLGSSLGTLFEILFANLIKNGVDVDKEEYKRIILESVLAGIVAKTNLIEEHDAMFDENSGIE